MWEAIDVLCLLTGVGLILIGVNGTRRSETYYALPVLFIGGVIAACSLLSETVRALWFC